MSRPVTSRPVVPRPLLVSADPALTDELLRLAAAAGAVPEVVDDPGACAHAWPTAPAVLVGGDLAERVVRAGPRRRPGVHVVGWAPATEPLLRAALDLGAESVCELPRAEGRLVELLTDVADARSGPRAPGRVVGVIGGSGGVGATTFACALGQVAASAGSVLVVDRDRLGPGADRVLGLEGLPGVRWDDLAHGGGRLGATALREAVPARGGLGVLSWRAPAPDGEVGGPGPEAVREVLEAARRGHDLVVVDLPRGADEDRDTAVRCDRVLVVTGTTVPALTATARTCRWLGPPDPLRLLVRGHGVEADAVARVTGVAVTGHVPHQRGLAESVDLGAGPIRSARSPLARAARLAWHRTVAELGAVPAAA